MPLDGDDSRELLKQLVDMITSHLDTSEEENIIPDPEPDQDFKKIRSAVLGIPDAGSMDGMEV